MKLNVLDFPTPEAALAAADDGDRVYFPSTQAYRAPLGGFQIRRDIELYGDGAGDLGTAKGTTFWPYDDVRSDSHVFVLNPIPGGELRNVYLHDFKISKRPEAAGKDGRDGIRCVHASNQKTSALRLERVVILNMQENGFNFVGLNGGVEAVVALSMRNCSASFCKKGLYLRYVVQADILNCTFISNDENGISALTSSVGIYNSGLDDNCLTIGAGTDEGNLRLEQCNVAQVIGCHFEKIYKGGSKLGCVFKDCGGAGYIGGCYFTNDIAPDGATGIFIKGGNENGPITVGTNRFSQVSTLVNVEDVPDPVVYPQFSVTTPSNVVLPSSNRGLFAVPHVNRGGGGSGDNLRSGLAVPAGADLPTANLRDGMLGYESTGTSLSLRAAGAWVSLNKDIDGSSLSNTSTKRVPVDRLKIGLYIFTFTSQSVAPGATVGFDVASFGGASGINFSTGKPIALFLYDNNMPNGANPDTRNVGKLVPFLSISKTTPNDKWYFMIYNSTGSAIGLNGLAAQILIAVL